MLEHYEDIIEEKIENNEKLARCIFCNRIEIEPNLWITLHRELEKKAQKILISSICPDDSDKQ